MTKTNFIVIAVVATLFANAADCAALRKQQCAVYPPGEQGNSMTPQDTRNPTMAKCRTTASAAETNAAQWVNIGSNSGLFAFDWESAGVQGLNLASSPQSLRRGVAILKSRRREVASGAYVMIPICLFSSVVPEAYDLKPSAASHPLLPFDGMPDEKAMSGFAGILDRVWKKEFSIHDYADPMTETNRAAYSANVARMRDLIGWCRQEGLRPVFVLPPAAKCLRDLFPDSFLKAYVYDFIRDVTKGTCVKFLDYWQDAEFLDERLYATSLFLNKTGRRRFTKKVMDDCIPEREPFRLPVPMVWQVNSDTLSRRRYLKDIDYLREHTRADILQLAPVEGVMPEDVDQFHAPVKELVEYARSRGFRVILRTSPRTKGFFSVGVFSGKAGVPVTGPLPCVLEDQSRAQALTVDVEGTLDKDGFVALESTAKWNRDKIMPLYARPLRAWAFDPVGSDSYRNGSLEDVTARLRIVYRDNRTVKVELDLGPAYAGKRAFLLAAHYFNCYELYEAADWWFRRLFDSLADVPLSGAAQDETGYMSLNAWGSDPFRGRFWSEAAERYWRDTLHTDYARLLFDMRRAPDSDRAVRVKAFNRYWDEFRRVPVECERKVADYQMAHHVDPFLACHSTYHISLDSDDIQKNACDYWTIPRDYGFTDEGLLWPIRLGVLACSREKFGFHMYYSKDPEAVYRNMVDCAPFKLREFHHAYNDGKWGLAYREEPFVSNVFKLDTEIAKLDAFQKGVMPRMDVLVVFGEFAHYNWLPDGEKARSKWDVNGSLRIMDKASEMWKAGYRCALVPDRLIEEGRVKFENGRFMVYPGRAWTSKEPDNPVAFDKCVFLYPRYAKKETWSFLNGAAEKGASLAVVGPADRDFHNDSASFRGTHFAEWSLDILSALGCAKSAISGGAVYDDGSFALVSRGILDGKPVVFDFTVDGYRYKGSHTGILAVRGGKVAHATPGWKLETTPVEDSARSDRPCRTRSPAFQARSRDPNPKKGVTCN